MKVARNFCITLHVCQRSLKSPDAVRSEATKASVCGRQSPRVSGFQSWNDNYYTRRHRPSMCRSEGQWAPARADGTRSGVQERVAATRCVTGRCSNVSEPAPTMQLAYAPCLAPATPMRCIFHPSNRPELPQSPAPLSIKRRCRSDRFRAQDPFENRFGGNVAVLSPQRWGVSTAFNSCSARKAAIRTVSLERERQALARVEACSAGDGSESRPVPSEEELSGSTATSRSKSRLDILVERFRLADAAETADTLFELASEGRGVVDEGKDPGRFNSIARASVIDGLDTENCVRVLEALQQCGFKGKEIDRLCSRDRLLRVLAVEPDSVSGIFSLLTEDIGFRPRRARRIISLNPSLLGQGVDSLRERVALLEGIFLTRADIRRATDTYPLVLKLDISNAKTVIEYLCTPRVGFISRSLRTIVRRAPWLLECDVHSELVPTVEWLRSTFPSLSVEALIRACPALLTTSPRDMVLVVTFLVCTAELEDPAVVAVVRQFPAILTASVPQQLDVAYAFLRDEVGLHADDLARIIRAFPATLTLDVETEIRASVLFLQNAGMKNVSRVVARLPPVLSFDVETCLKPKMKYVEESLGLSPFEVFRFPAFFGYDFVGRIEPRTRFLQVRGFVLSEVGLRRALAPTDDVFCEFIARASVQEYTEFRLALHQKRAELRRAQDDGVVDTSPNDEQENEYTNEKLEEDSASSVHEDGDSSTQNDMSALMDEQSVTTPSASTMQSSDLAEAPSKEPPKLAPPPVWPPAEEQKGDPKNFDEDSSETWTLIDPTLSTPVVDGYADESLTDSADGSDGVSGVPQAEVVLPLQLEPFPLPERRRRKRRSHVSDTYAWRAESSQPGKPSGD